MSSKHQSSGNIVPGRTLPALPAKWKNQSAVFIRQARAHADVPAISDGSGEKLTYGEVLLRALALSRVLARQLDDNPYVPIMLPTSTAGALINLAVTLLGKIPVNINYMSKDTAVRAAMALCGGATQYISTDELIKRFKLLAPPAEGSEGTTYRMIEVKTLKDQVTKIDQGWAWTAAKVMPLWALALVLPGLRQGLDDTATVIFTSGSTGDGKGVVLSHRNVLSNVWQIYHQAQVPNDAVVLGILPFFHSMGYTVTLWTVLALGLEAVYHHNPLEAQRIGELMEEHGVTIMACTPTLMRPFLKRCTKEQFATVQWLVLGSEKLKPELVTDVQAKLGITPVDGYGLTQCSPLVAANVRSKVRTPDGRQVDGNKLGTVGQPVPGTDVKIVDLNSGEALPVGKEGVIYVRGPQVFQGYLGLSEETARVLSKDGWFNTEDIGFIDEDGFLHITDRLSRFAKIGGEMVPVGKVESEIRRLTQADELAFALTVLPDDKKGEKVVVVYTADLTQTPAEVCALLDATDMSKLWIPDVKNFVKIDTALPVAATGKLDLKAIKEIAKARLPK